MKSKILAMVVLLAVPGASYASFASNFAVKRVFTIESARNNNSLTARLTDSRGGVHDLICVEAHRGHLFYSGILHLNSATPGHRGGAEKVYLKSGDCQSVRTMVLNENHATEIVIEKQFSGAMAITEIRIHE